MCELCGRRPAWKHYFENASGRSFHLTLCPWDLVLMRLSHG